MREAEIYGIACRQLALIMRANISPLSALQICADQTENKKLKKTLKGLIRDLSGGDKLSDAMKQQGDRFPVIVICAVEGAEKNGNWEQMLTGLASYFESESRLRVNSRHSTILPALMAVLCLFVLALLTLQILPRFMQMFDGLAFEPPPFTARVMAVSNLFSSYGAYLALSLAGVILLWFLFSLSRLGKNCNAAIRMHLPLSGGVNRNILFARFCKALSVLLKNGMPMQEAVRVIEDTMDGNERVRADLQRAAGRVAEGMSLSKAMADSDVFSPMILQMTAIGEESGTLTEILDDMANYYERRTGRLSYRRAVVLESVLVVILGLIMCVCLGAMMQTMIRFYDMVSGM